MSRRVLVRFTAAFAIVLSLGFPGAISASTSAPGSHFSLLDLGDDDGDGIPNYLDPDDDNDGVTDEDTNSNPVGVEPDSSSDNPSGSGQPNVVGTTPTQSETGTNVTTLPNTGTGSNMILQIGIAVAGVSVLFLCAWAVRILLREA